MAKRGWYLLAYDIACPRRLQKVQRLLKGEGLAAQLSVFFVFGSQAEVSGLLDRVAERIHVREDDVRCWPIDHPGAVWFHGEPPVKTGTAGPQASARTGGEQATARLGGAPYAGEVAGLTGELLVVLDRRESTVRFEGRALRVQHAGGWERIPWGCVGLVVVHGNPSVSCDVWRALAERGVPAVMLPSRGTGAAAWAGAGLSTSIQVRRRQHRAASDPPQRLAVAREIVLAKLSAQRALVQGLGSGTIPVLFDTGGTAAVMATLDSQLAVARTAPDPTTLMGAEGAAASAWYQWLCEHLPGRWRFSGRNRRPPRDPVNALLSLTYTLAMTEARYQLETAGLDPALGFLHGVVPGRDSLMLDVVEPLRPGVDAFVLRLLERVVEPRDFHYSQRDGCRLNKAAQGTYYQAWAAHRLEWPGLEAPAACGSDEEEAPTGTLSGAAWRVVQSLRRLLPDLGDEPQSDG